jgi:hypothetical protein
MKFLLQNLVCAMLSVSVMAVFLRGDVDETLSSRESVSVGESVRQLLVDADRSKRCFVDGSNRGRTNPHDADFYENPWNANRDRGDWGKCLPEEVFGVLCVHENAHGLNDGNWTPSDGPLHDGPAQELFLKLQQIHDDYCVHVDIKVPDSVQESFNDFFFARNNYALGGPAPPVSENVIPITVTTLPAGQGKKYTDEHGQIKPILTMVRGSTYVFDTSEATNAGHPLLVGTAENFPHENSVSAGNPGSPGSYTTFTVPLDAPDELSYYCLYHAGMGNTITVVDPVRRLHEEGPITYDMACTQTYPDNPRMALQMSLYCLLGFIDKSIDTSIVHRDYGLSDTCETILRHNMRHQLSEETVLAPHMFCASDSEENTCTVHADIRLDGVNTCEKYCAQFDNLECKAASVNTWSDQCTELRPWSCEEPAMNSNLMCQCGPVAIPYVSNDVVTTACAKQMLPSSHTPYKFCDQDLAAGTCTTQARLNVLDSGTCAEYCQVHELECVATYEDWDCVGYREHTCDYSGSSYMLCECGEPSTPVEEAVTTTPNCDAFCSQTGEVCISASSTPAENCVLSNGLPCQLPEDFATQLNYVCGSDIERPEVVEQMATASCAHMMFYRDPVSRPRTFCPPQTLESDEDDTCTVLAYMYSVADTHEGRTCDAYCNSFPGMKCVAAAEEVNNDCNVRQTLACDEPYTSSTSDLLCSCAIDESKMNAAVTAANTPIAPACENLMLSPSKDTAKVERVCESYPDQNACSVVGYVRDLPARSCDEFCASYHGMQCITAAVNKWSTCEEDYAIECSEATSSNDMLCTCGFKDASPRANYFDMGPVFDTPNALRTCPVYTTATNDQGNEYHTNEGERKYTMVELTLDIDKAGTSAAATDIKVRPDFSNSDRDTYNTAHVEACDGFESQIREGDPAEKCSFGHRLDSSQNCYGKVYGQNYHEASAACAERGGHLVHIDDEAEYALLKEIFGDQSFNIGLRDVGGRDWEWDGYPGVKFDPYVEESPLPQLNSDEREDCVRLDLGDEELTGKYCYERETYMCEGIRDPKTGLGGDLLADEGGFCLWYLDDPTLELPDDEDNGFENTELAYNLLFDEDRTTRKYIEIYGELYPAVGIPGHSVNEANWEHFTYGLLGFDSDEPLVEKSNHDKAYHCHYSPTNFGMARIYIQQHMLERIYPGSMHKHCFCGYKHLGHFVDRCDCTRSGERNGQCQEHHREQLWTETYHQTGEYVYCNNGNCEGASP